MLISSGSLVVNYGIGVSAGLAKLSPMKVAGCAVSVIGCILFTLGDYMLPSDQKKEA